MQHTDHSPVVRAEEDGNAISRENGQRLMGEFRQEAIGAGIFFGSAQLWNNPNPGAMNLFGTSDYRRKLL